MPFHYRLGKMVNCSACSGIIHRDEPVSAAFSQEGKRSYYHKGCEEKAEYLSRWREEAAWAFRPVRLSLTEWEACSPKKHLGVWQSIFIARRDEDIWCPDCGLKIARHEGLTCSSCGARGIVVGVEATKMVFTHRQPLYKLLVHCTEKGEDSTSYAISSGFTPVAITSRKKVETAESQAPAMMLEYEPKENLKKGLKV
ncbi:hypothetical protein E6H12_08330 [Candidatus Bathyarchaeota archaeon]|nr:MAG: hypothetical protein E6H12_08330 [Candidatus Bathyarchaeota archaeon]